MREKCIFGGMRKMLLCLLFMCTLLLDVAAQSNEGTQFAFGFMEHLDRSHERVVVITAREATSGLVEIPGQGWSQNFEVTSNGFVQIDLPNFAETIGSENIENNAVFIQATDTVSAYIHQFFEKRSDASLLLPLESLGNEYYVLAFQGLSLGARDWPSEFLIVAVDDNTQIEITPSAATIGGQTPGVPFSITLQRGQTYQVQTARGADDLTGSYLKGNKSFSLFSGALWTNVPSNCGERDNLQEQMFPVHAFSRRFGVVPNAQVAFDLYRVLAANNNTTIVINEGASQETIVLQKGEFYEFQRSDPFFLTSTHPVILGQYLVGENCNRHPNRIGDPALLLINSAQQFRNTVTLYSPITGNIEEHYLNIMVKTESIAEVILDGQNLVDQGIVFRVFPGNEDFSYTTVQVEEGAHTVSSGGCGLNVSAYGYGTFDSYAYSAGASFKQVAVPDFPDTICLVDGINDSVDLEEWRYQVNWDMGDGTVYDSVAIVHQYAAEGRYQIRTIIRDLCAELSDTFYQNVVIEQGPIIQALDSLAFCEGDQVQLIGPAIRDAVFTWEGPNDFASNSPSPILGNASLALAGDYFLSVQTNLCPSLPNLQHVTIFSNPLPELGPDTTLCPEDTSTFLTLNPGRYEAYFWSDGSTDSSFVASSTGELQVAVIDQNGCEGEDQLLISLFCPTPDTMMVDTTGSPVDSTTMNQDTSTINNPMDSTQTGMPQDSTVVPIDTSSTMQDTSQVITDTTAVLSNRLIYYVPNAFSPNDDGINDGFSIYGDHIEISELKVFDRWGGLIWQSHSANTIWDGRAHGEVLGIGTYYWIAKLEGVTPAGNKLEEVTTGTILLIR